MIFHLNYIISWFVEFVVGIFSVLWTGSWWIMNKYAMHGPFGFGPGISRDRAAWGLGSHRHSPILISNDRHIILYYIILYYIILYYIVLYYIILYCIILYYIIYIRAWIKKTGANKKCAYFRYFRCCTLARIPNDTDMRTIGRHSLFALRILAMLQEGFYWDTFSQMCGSQIQIGGWDPFSTLHMTKRCVRKYANNGAFGAAVVEDAAFGSWGWHCGKEASQPLLSLSMLRDIFWSRLLEQLKLVKRVVMVCIWFSNRQFDDGISPFCCIFESYL